MMPSRRQDRQPSPRARAVDGRAKILLLVAYTVALFFIGRLGGLAAAALLLLAVGAAGGLRWGRVLSSAAPAYLIVAFLLLYNAVSAGWAAALLVAGRVLLLVYASLALASLSTPTELSEALRRLLAPLGRVGIPVRDATTALSIALRFIPLIAGELACVRAAQASRGACLDHGGVRARLAAWGGLMVPVLVGLFRRADRLACAMDARCFGACAAPTSLDGRRFGLGDGAFLLVGIALCTGLVLVP